MKEVIERNLRSIQLDNNHRYNSWEHCYKAFANFDDSQDYLALHLAFYLASWGMYRGSSGLLWKDYKVHVEAVEIIKEFQDQRMSFSNKLPDISLVMQLVDGLRKYYSSISFYNGEDKKAQITPTDTLISKIILETLGTLPAFDRYFNKGLFGKEYSTLNKTTLNILYERIKNLEPDILCLTALLKEERGMIYPTMKIIDMYFWQLGFETK